MKSKILELMYSWTLGLPHEVKILEAYQMLKKQGKRQWSGKFFSLFVQGESKTGSPYPLPRHSTSIGLPGSTERAAEEMGALELLDGQRELQGV